MRIFHLETSVWLPAPVERVFDFFARAENLEQLTPPFLRFRITTRVPIEMRRGARIDYQLRLHGIPIRWQSEITAWNPPRLFVDEQRRGPYRLWRHTHRFETWKGGTQVADDVEYATWGGVMVNRLLVSRDLRRIFAYRHAVLQAHFSPGRPDPTGTSRP